MEYFVIGESEIVTGFALVGVKGLAAFTRQDALEAFNKMTGQSASIDAPTSQERPKVLILSEAVSDMIQDEVMDWQMKGKAPLIVEVPGLNGHLPGRKTLTDSIKEAVGVSV